MDRDELIRRLEELRPEFAKIMRQFGAHEPDWEPLERFLCGDFMFMGYSQGIRMYKHSLTRHYLHLDTEGNAYEYLESKDQYRKIAPERAIARAFEDLDSCLRLDPVEGGT